MAAQRSSPYIPKAYIYPNLFWNEAVIEGSFRPHSALLHFHDGLWVTIIWAGLSVITPVHLRLTAQHGWQLWFAEGYCTRCLDPKHLNTDAVTGCVAERRIFRPACLHM